MISKNTRGSEWRKWDLHIHTPSSYDYKNRNITDEDFVKEISKYEVSAIAITDHHVIDIKRIKNISKLAEKQNIVVFPGIEILSESRGKEPIHIVGIFSEECNIDYIWPQIENRTRIREIKGKGRKPNEIYCDLDDTINLIHELGGIVTIHAGNKSNSIDNISHALPHGEAQKRDIAEKVDVFEVATEKDVEDYKSIINKRISREIRKKLPIIICSDNHDIKKYSVKQNCWIKADLTFNGLKQILFEPYSRVRIQAGKPEPKNDYQIIDSICFDNNEMGRQEILFNPNLNTIIGGRSSGKSILVGCLSVLLNSGKAPKVPTKYFERYNEYIKRISKDASVKWRDGSSEDRKIIYYAQSEISEIVHPNEDGTTGINDIIKNIIRKDFESFIEAYKSNSTLNTTEINRKINTFCELKRRIHEKEKDISDIGNKIGIIAGIKKLEKEIEDIKKSIKGYLTAEEDIEFKKLKENLERDEILQQTLASDKNQLEIIKKIKIFNNIDPMISSVSDNYYKSLFDFYEKLKTDTEKSWIEFIDRLKNEIEKKEKDISETRSKIIVSELYKKGCRFNENNELLSLKEETLRSEINKKNEIEKIEMELSKLRELLINCKTKIWTCFEEYKKNIEELAEKLVIEKDKIKINAKVIFRYKVFYEQISQTIDMRSKEIQQYDFDRADIIDKEKYMSEIYEKIINYKFTLKKDFQQALIDLYAKSYYKITFDIIYDGESFEMMSEGKKAFIALRLLLDFDNSECPIIIDQPEDDLDNRAIYEKLVKYLREQKTKRQIILVTHNPNVVVGADAELVIVANQHGIDSPNQENIKFEYYCNSIENSFNDKSMSVTLLKQGIREHICEILEGGVTAFQIREKKYGYKPL